MDRLPKRLIPLLFLLLCLPIATFADPVEDRPIVVGCDPDYPPYEFVTMEGEPAGFNVELTRAIGEVMGMEVEIRFGPWIELRRKLAAGRIDILQGVPFSEGRSAALDFSPPHSQVHQALWVRSDSPIDALEDLAGLEVLVTRDGVMHEFMVHRPELGARLVPVDSLEDALRLLAIGEHDAALGAKLPGEYLLGRLQVDNVVPIARPLLSQDYGYAVKKGDRELLALFNEGLALLKRSGRYKELYNKWLGLLPASEGIPRSRIIRIGTTVLGPLLLILVLNALWSRTLKRQVRMRTVALEREVAARQRAMDELKLHQQQLLQADKMASLGVLVSGVAHEINNPNALVLLNVPQMQRAWVDIAPVLEERFEQRGDFQVGRIDYSQMREDIPDMLEEMQEGAGRIKRIVDDLKGFARRDDSGYAESVELNAVVKAALRLVENPLKKATDRFTVSLEEDLPSFRGNAQRIEQVVVNLILNACQALESMQQGVSLRTAFRPEADELILEVEDEGCGIAPAHLSMLTDPFFTTKREDGGTGLGLSVSAGIVEEHGGRFEFDSAPGAGTLVRMILPREIYDR